MATADDEQYKVRCTQIDRHDIQTEYCRVCADLAYWGDRQAEAEEAYVLAKAALARARASASETARQVAPKATLKTVADRAEKADIVRSATIRYAAATAQRTRMRVTVNAISTKADMLVSLGATLRKEMRPNPTILENAEDDE